jgi:hypothetical protein
MKQLICIIACALIAACTGPQQSEIPDIRDRPVPGCTETPSACVGGYVIFDSTKSARKVTSVEGPLSPNELNSIHPSHVDNAVRNGFTFYWPDSDDQTGRLAYEARMAKDTSS